ncbi:hypothetical protein [Novosphingobium sp. KN65.2]|uniref:hypothetical protein n=1 Tax=Novosphingobium sp. KN65.2 TaxID=1478134 RepID=UPI0005E17D0E|nr:hypothetical protein [Novosphingobium sp. KN65.2]CDO35826.1 hypothetical protein SPHV1_2270172 [Novosphingobium sp. KN65.2]
MKIEQTGENEYRVGGMYKVVMPDPDHSDVDVLNVLLTQMHEGRHEFHPTRKMDERLWSIEGQMVALPQFLPEDQVDEEGERIPAPDTEEYARQLLAEALSMPDAGNEI